MLFQLDFDQVAEAGRRTRHRPTFPVAQLAQATVPGLAQSEFVRTYVRFHHNAWYLPLVEAHVRAWLKKVVFTVPPVVFAGGAEMSCGKELADE